MYSYTDCNNLDKTRKKTSETGHINYGCNAKGGNFTCGWVAKDSELNLQGCSLWKEKTDNQVRMEI